MQLLDDSSAITAFTSTLMPNEELYENNILIPVEPEIPDIVEEPDTECQDTIDLLENS